MSTASLALAGVKRHACDHAGCDKAFITRSKLKLHQLIHSDERPHKCDFEGCSAAFKRKHHLDQHRFIHGGDKPFACDVVDGCTATFVKNGDLIRHKRTHTGAKPYKCDHGGCDSAFAHKCALLVHQRVHTGEKPYVCDFEGCGAAFAQVGDLAKHKRTHTGERPYTCAICDAAFTQFGSLILHKRIHSGEKPYKCTSDGCGAKFGRKDVMLTHFRAMHTLEGQARQKKQEQRVACILEAAGLHFKREHHIDFRCVTDIDGSFARIDFVLMIHNNMLIFLEVDEGQHRFGPNGGTIKCDMKRMSHIMLSLTVGGNTLPISFIRYNPDAFHVRGEICTVQRRDREAALIKLLKDPKSFTDAPLSIRYMFYDSADGINADVSQDPDYNDHMAECCLSPILHA